MQQLPYIKEMTIAELHEEAMSRQMAAEDGQLYGGESDRQESVVKELRHRRHVWPLIDRLEDLQAQLSSLPAEIARTTEDLAILKSWQVGYRTREHLARKGRETSKL